MKTFTRIAMLFLIVMMASSSTQAASQNNVLPRSDDHMLSSYLSGTDYDAYLSSFGSQAGTNDSARPVVIDVFSYKSASNVEHVQDFLGRSGLLTNAVFAYIVAFDGETV